MKKRLLTYCLIGLIFGVLDWYYLNLLANFPWGSLGEKLIIVPIIILLNFGIWLVPVLAIVIHEIYSSKSVRLSTLSGIVTWGFSILGYYTYYTVLLSFWGLPHMEHMLVTKEHPATFWQDWFETFQVVILNQFLEWIPVAIVGGGVLGYTTGKLLLNRVTKPRRDQELPGKTR